MWVRKLLSHTLGTTSLPCLYVVLIFSLENLLLITTHYLYFCAALNTLANVCRGSIVLFYITLYYSTLLFGILLSLLCMTAMVLKINWAPWGILGAHHAKDSPWSTHRSPSTTSVHSQLQPGGIMNGHWICFLGWWVNISTLITKLRNSFKYLRTLLKLCYY